MTTKRQLLEAIQALPEDLTLEEAVERLYWLYKVRRGLGMRSEAEIKQAPDTGEDISAVPKTPKRQFGALAGKGRVTDAFFEPLPANELDPWGIGKLPEAAVVAQDLPGCLLAQDFRPLAITVVHGQRAGALPGPHRDPFDRMLIAQAQAEGVPIVSNEEIFDSYGVQRIW